MALFKRRKVKKSKRPYKFENLKPKAKTPKACEKVIEEFQVAIGDFKLSIVDPLRGGEVLMPIGETEPPRHEGTKTVWCRNWMD